MTRHVRPILLHFCHWACTLILNTLIRIMSYKSFKIGPMWGPCFPYLPTCRRWIVQPFISFSFVDMNKRYFVKATHIFFLFLNFLFLSRKKHKFKKKHQLILHFIIFVKLYNIYYIGTEVF